MSLVLGLSVTSKDIHGELVDGVTGEGDHLDRAVLDVDHIGDFLAEIPADADLHAIGLTWSHDAETEAIKVREALDVYAGGAPVVPVRDVDAAEALARGIAEKAGQDFLIVVVVEPDNAVVATIDGFHIAVESIDHADTATLTDRVRALVHAARPSPDAVYVLGSENPNALVAAIQQETDRPVVTATEADFALTRGAALASAHTANIPAVPAPHHHVSRVRVLTAALGVAAVVFVVSVSLALTAYGAPAEQQQQPVRPVAVESAPVPQQPVAETPLPKTPPVQAKTINIVPAAPAPPPQAPAPPRLRDRILDKVPFADRFR
ncbi:DUF7159 family protein [Mycolicibacterium diernhoferi]|uniref:DUF7159 domain-containing protein n=1 Tax=Mycolicibacterium diernhoferi TaxID=1801 RepID=A0A1Q4H7S7_9MYCO|nr:hypothetical protein [Mycolicibacterium diernhoferi]OJZ63525.1 hypothetical protein BRW64_22100 [Mycolicibacterium diernhoferi]OPE48532.1 hypothetical protein BV510_23610 [Mycolicibacterium diernhoferi]PEG51766.1 hypothetical protein CRI78_24870 [Mycolicibacterium diernhoferi]QYL24455.1 hypothetical protein K0O62_09480 [Mycolicibacterium diernhoferi]